MAKQQSMYFCQECGASSPRWQGRCFECNAWNSFVEEKVTTTKKSNGTEKKLSQSEARSLFEFQEEGDQAYLGKRFSTQFAEIDRVLGGGLVEGSLLLFGGDPGVGKSTLLLQIIGAISAKFPTLYISGEESGHQVAARAQRLTIKKNENLFFLSTSNLEEAYNLCEKQKPIFAVVDSVQTLSSQELESAPGTVSQVREVAHKFLELAKGQNITIALVGHVTKEGQIAGPKLLEHMVDGVFFFEQANQGSYRLLKSYKNRFGSVNELAVLEMQSRGLVEITNPSQRFLEERNTQAAGSAIVAQVEGTRALLTEVQTLTQRCYQGFPRRTAQGVDQNRLAVLLAVLEKHLDLNFSQEDVYCKVASGEKITESAADLPLAFSLISALLNKTLPADLLLVGEVGLGGELRSVSSIAPRLNEAKSVGIQRAIIPHWNSKELEKIDGIEVIVCKNLQQAFDKIYRQ
jgi:DNA repair protein RadA/Sms